MSEPTPNPEPAADAAAAKPAAPKGPPLPMMLGVVGGALAIGVALGAFVVAPPLLAARGKAPVAAKAGESSEGGHEDAKGKGKGKDAHEKTIVYRIDNLVVNPAGSQGTRFLMAAVAFEMRDQKAADAIRDRDVQVRDAVISRLESESLESLTRAGARDSIKLGLRDVVRPILGGDTPLRVYLPSFVIQ